MSDELPRSPDRESSRASPPGLWGRGLLALYRGLLRAYPRAFRRRFGEDMTADVAAMLSGAKPLAAGRVILADLVRSVARERLRQLGARRRRAVARGRARPRRVLMLLNEVRHGARMLGRSPGFTAAASGGLALGIGATTAIFSVLNAVVLRPLPYEEPERLVRLWEVTPGGEDFSTSQPNALDFRARNRTLDALAAFAGRQPTLTGDGPPERVAGALVTPELFGMLGAAPLLGRGFSAEEARPGRAARVVVLSESFWRTRFGADPGILDRTLMLNGGAFDVIGVMPASFTFPADAVLWLPLVLDANAARGDHRISAIGRLRPGVTLEDAAADLRRVASELSTLYPESNGGWTVRLASFPEWIIGPALRRTILVLLLAAGLLTLMACVNVAHLLLVRAAAREGEMRLRAALGATRERLVAQLASESLLLALLAGALGVALAYAGVPLLVRLAPAGLPRIEEAAVDARVLAFAALAAAATGLLFGLAPALYGARHDLHTSLRAGGRVAGAAGQRVRGALLVGELALATTLLVGATLLTSSFARLRSIDTGYDTAHVLAVPVALSGRYYDGCDARAGGECDPAAGAARMAAFLARARVAIEALPGVATVGATSLTPLGGGNTGQEITVEGYVPSGRADQPFVDWRVVTAGFFEAVGLPIVRGRGFTAAEERDGARVLVVSESLARRYWPGEEALGKRIAFGVSSSNWQTIVGIARDMRDVELESGPRPVAFLPYGSASWRFMTLLVRARGDAPALADPVRRAIWTIDPTLPLPEVRPLTAYRDDATAGARFSMLLMTVFAAMGLLLGVLGVYGVTMFSVARQTREFGVRIALGALRADVLRLVLRRVLLQIVTGVLLGLAGAAALSRLLDALLFDTPSRDPLLYVAAAGALGSIALIAALLPALRAARVDPRVALAAE